VDAAIAHIHSMARQHTDSIVTGDTKTGSVSRARRQRHRAAQGVHAVADGGEFGMGAEIGISTDKFHARGPVGVEQLTSYKFWCGAADKFDPDRIRPRPI